MERLNSCFIEIMNKTDKTLDEKLYCAVVKCDFEEVKKLIKEGADVNYADKEGETPLFWACYGAHPNLAVYLIENGANIFHKNNYGEKPIDIARRNEGERGDKLVKILILYRKSLILKRIDNIVTLFAVLSCVSFVFAIIGVDCNFFPINAMLGLLLMVFIMLELSKVQ